MTEVLTATGLAKAYKGRRVVDGMSMSVNAGEIVGLLGPNGAGKTTCFYLMVGLVTSDEGAITLSGEDVTDLPIHLRARRGLGYLPQEASIFRRMTVEDNIMAILETRDVCLRKSDKPNVTDYFTNFTSHISGTRLGKACQVASDDVLRLHVP